MVRARVRVRARVMTSLNVREKKDFYERNFRYILIDEEADGGGRRGGGYCRSPCTHSF